MVNVFTKEEYLKWVENLRDINLNKAMISYFPFLLPRNRWTGEVSEDYDYTYNEMEAMPKGWLIAFGYELLCELREALVKINYLDKYRITQIKEKYGSLRWYDLGCSEEGFYLIRKYEDLSFKYCLYCGKPVTHKTLGWITYVCEECADKLNFNVVPADDEKEYEYYNE